MLVLVLLIFGLKCFRENKKYCYSQCFLFIMLSSFWNEIDSDCNCHKNIDIFIRIVTNEKYIC